MKKRWINSVIIIMTILLMPLSSMAKNKFEKEVDVEAGAVKLVREVQQGGYYVITASELKEMKDAGKDIVIVDTMPYEDSYKKAHVPGAKQFLFPIPPMDQWDNAETNGKTEKGSAKYFAPTKSPNANITSATSLPFPVFTYS